MRRELAASAAAALALALAAASGAAGAPSVLAKMPAGGDARDVARDAGVTLVRSFPDIGWAEFAARATDVGAARERLLDDPRVFRLDFQRRGESLDVDAVPSDTFTASPPQFSDGVKTDYQWQQGRFYPAWDIGRASARTRIAVVDSEIDTAHPDLAGKVAAAYNAERQTAAYGTSDVRASEAQIAQANASPFDNDLHGTHVAGLAAAATDNGIGVAGAGFDASLMPVKVTLTVPAGPAGDATYVANAIDGILWAADHGADVLNMSFGTAAYHQALADAVAHAAAKDVLVAAAAGNTQDDPTAPGVPLYPAALPRVVAVGATDPTGAITTFSTNGAYVDVAAPGSRILSTWDTRAPGAATGAGPLTGYQVLTGTSMSSPIVAGLAALVRDLRPDLSAAQVESVIEDSADDRGPPGRDPAYGAGVIDAEAALRAAAAAPAGQPPVAPAAAAGHGPPLRRARARIAYRCTVGEKAVPVGAARRLGVARDARLVCRGRTVPPLGRARLRLERRAQGGWIRIGSFPTTADGRFGFVVRLRTPGSWTVRAALAASASRAAAAGPAAKVAVRGSRA